MDYGLPALCFFAEVSFDAVCWVLWAATIRHMAREVAGCSSFARPMCRALQHSSDVDCSTVICVLTRRSAVSPSRRSRLVGCVDFFFWRTGGILGCRVFGEFCDWTSKRLHRRAAAGLRSLQSIKAWTGGWLDRTQVPQGALGPWTPSPTRGCLIANPDIMRPKRSHGKGWRCSDQLVIPDLVRRMDVRFTPQKNRYDCTPVSELSVPTLPTGRLLVDKQESEIPNDWIPISYRKRTNYAVPF